MTNLPQGWEVKKLGDIAEIQIGKTPSRNNIDFFQGENIWLSIRDLKSKFVSSSSEKISNEAISKTNMKVVPKGTLLMSFKLTLGKTAFAECDLYTNEAIAAIFIKNKNINKYFLDYVLKFTDLEKYVDNAVKGKTLNKQKLKQIEILLPKNIKEQERIVGILDENFAKIDENIKILEQDLLNLDELMQSALQKAFNPLKDNAKENYKLPQGWEWKSLGEIANTSSGGTPSRNKKEYWENGNIKWLKSGELNDGYIDFIEENITEEAIKNSSAKIFQKGTLLIAMYGATAGKLGILNLDSTTNQAICAFLHKDKNIKFLEKFLFYFLFFLRDKIIKDSFGGAQPNINQTYIKNLQIPLPPIKEQEQIASHLDELSSHVKNLKQNYQAQIKDLQELKNSLLDKAFKGNL
ncbi:restriction endonuclease subunit S [Campylobacter coli]|uniref:restriction endonuclease subunit S n=1 Tax=Campylobacter coli TaxID=195 RepID=UPI00127C7E7F|nr:restriction endonuclease subunit S [Campylobacter coli]EAH4591495.1 restriction endonuclease subunit S [Campylobacter coli]EAI3219732.1 restriction endonuclease subunit S [Campylobacter coli]EAI8659176.1 restriction endonuclease subunit S [Campylobacter coli]EAJ6217325.1 restriction endonuclease subunit S [Campylobacter coli]EAL2419365.1 restriction endonuclease subunit S [Campylobacter coli]